MCCSLTIPDRAARSRAAATAGVQIEPHFRFRGCEVATHAEDFEAGFTREPRQVLDGSSWHTGLFHELM